MCAVPPFWPIPRETGRPDGPGLLDTKAARVSTPVGCDLKNVRKAVQLKHTALQINYNSVHSLSAFSKKAINLIYCMLSRSVVSSSL